MIRKATIADLDAIEAIYNAIHDQEEAGVVTIGWDRAIYPTRATAAAAIQLDDMYVLEHEGRVVAAARINQEQVPEYADAPWEHDAPADQVLVLHTLVVDPAAGGHGFGKQFVAFYENMARESNCPFLRMDTNARNVRARALYAKLGYKEPGIVPCVFNGIPGVQLVCLEKKL